jgi:hypothetical protein
MLERDGEVVVTYRGRPLLVLRPWSEPSAKGEPEPIDYYARLKQRAPKAMSASARRALDEANRGDR